MIHVVAGAVIDAEGRVLTAQRPPGKQLAGWWEFPGGKLEPGETRSAALIRELREELGINIRQPRPLMRLRHSYDFGEVLIDMWVVTRYEGVPRGLDGQALQWCGLDELGTVELLPADAPIVRALRLPEHLTRQSTPYYHVGGPAVSGRATSGSDVACRVSGLHGALCAGVDEAVTAVGAGADFLCMGHSLADGELAALCESVMVPVFAMGITLERAWELGATGINEVGD